MKYGFTSNHKAYGYVDIELPAGDFVVEVYNTGDNELKYYNLSLYSKNGLEHFKRHHDHPDYDW